MKAGVDCLKELEYAEYEREINSGTENMKRISRIQIKSRVRGKPIRKLPSLRRQGPLTPAAVRVRWDEAQVVLVLEAEGVQLQGEPPARAKPREFETMDVSPKVSDTSSEQPKVYHVMLKASQSV